MARSEAVGPPTCARRPYATPPVTIDSSHHSFSSGRLCTHSFSFYFKINCALRPQPTPCGPHPTPRLTIVSSGHSSSGGRLQLRHEPVGEVGDHVHAHRHRRVLVPHHRNELRLLGHVEATLPLEAGVLGELRDEEVHRARRRALLGRELGRGAANGGEEGGGRSNWQGCGLLGARRACGDGGGVNGGRSSAEGLGAELRRRGGGSGGAADGGEVARGARAVMVAVATASAPQLRAWSRSCSRACGGGGTMPVSGTSARGDGSASAPRHVYGAPTFPPPRLWPLGA
eukprot:350130-Chlamydomonas_euryale.AAC.1